MVTTPPPQAGSGPAPLLRAVVRLLLMASIATPAGAQIFKCTAGSGQVTYQNAPCPKNVRAEPVDIFENSWTADRAEKDAQWQRQAAGHHVVAGMPLRWVREALGEPAEISDTATAGATEVWLYNFPDRSVQVGILADQVLWSRETPVIAPLTRAAPESDATNGTSRAAPDAAAATPETPRVVTDTPGVVPVVPDTSRLVPDTPRAVTDTPRAVPDAPRAVPDAHRVASDRPQAAPDAARVAPDAASPQMIPKVSDSRHGIARGQDCKLALAALGKPDRQREVPAVDSGSDPMTEYFYEPAGSDDPMHTRIVCANGKVEGVERTVNR